MSEKNFDIYLEFQYTKLNLAAFNKLNGKLEYYKEQSYKSYFKNKESNFDELQRLKEENVNKVEKTNEWQLEGFKEKMGAETAQIDRAR